MHRPYAKVSRLPAKIRNEVNEMLYDGISYTKIIAWLEEQGHPGFNEMNISRWREGGYQAWLNAQERQDHREFLRGLAEQTKSDDSTFQDASIHLAQLQFFEALNRLEGADLATRVKENRKEFIQLLKTFTQFTATAFNVQNSEMTSRNKRRPNSSATGRRKNPSRTITWNASAPNLT